MTRHPVPRPWMPPTRAVIALGLIASATSALAQTSFAATTDRNNAPTAVNTAIANASAPGRTVASLLDYVRQNNPEYAAMRYEAEAAQERIEPAGALMDPKVQIEWRDITKMGEQGATLSPSRVGSTKYLVMQDLPWYGKRDLKRDIAQLEAAGAEGRARGNWAELAAKTKALCEGIAAAAKAAGVAIQSHQLGSMFGLFFNARPVTDYASAATSDQAAFKVWFHTMLEQGVYLAPSQFEAAFMSAAHSDADIAATVAASGLAFEAVCKQRK